MAVADLYRSRPVGPVSIHVDKDHREGFHLYVLRDLGCKDWQRRDLATFGTFSRDLAFWVADTLNEKLHQESTTREATP